MLIPSPLAELSQEMGTVVTGKLQSGTLSKGQTVLLMPNKIKVVVDNLIADDHERTSVQSGDNTQVR